MMKTATYPQLPIQSENLNRASRYGEAPQTTIKIKRIASVEEELTDRICRERNGQRILSLCEAVIQQISETYTGGWEDLSDFRDQLFDRLEASGEFNPKQVHCLVELSLDILYARKNEAYRRCSVDLGFLISTATGEISVN